MGKTSRKRWDGNVRSMAIIAKDREDITDEDLMFLRENYTSAGGLLPNAYSGGAFFTPTHVARFIVEALRGLSGGEFPPDARFLEPSCGSGVFIEHIEEAVYFRRSGVEIVGLEIDETSAKVASLLYPYANIVQGDAFTHGRRDYYDYVIGNPPFGITIDIPEDQCADFVTLRKAKGRRKGKSEFAFIELAIKAARPGGYIALILPKSIGFSGQAEPIRKYMRETCWHIASVELPPETFQHVGTSVSTDIHILRKVTPNARKIYVKYVEINPTLHRVEQTEETDAHTFWYEGQMPVFQAKVADIGYDKDGKLIDKWGDGLTQLDELLEPFTDADLVRSNIDPIAPFNGADHAFNVKISPFEEWRVKRGELAWWNVLTLGRGEIVEPSECSSWDFGWQDEIVRRYYEGLTDDNYEVEADECLIEAVACR